MEKLNILILHRLGDPSRAPLFLNKHVFLLKSYFPEHNYIYHDANLALPKYVAEAEFDAIILDVTFLAVRWWGEVTYRSIMEGYDFVRHSHAIKIAFPQDEYDCHQRLDDWMCYWSVDVVYSVISSHWNVLYPNYHKQGLIKLGFTGYIDETLIDVEAKPFWARVVDIGYRAKKLPPYFGWVGECKWRIGELVSEKAKDYSLVTDIVLGDKGTLYGNNWLNFIQDCKFTLGANSGSSLLDPYGEIQRQVKSYIAVNPGADFIDVEDNCFKGTDGLYSFTAISPRVFEAGLLESCQILVKGDYSHVISPWEHYIPIESDASDFAVVYEAMKDPVQVDRMRKNCKEALLSFDGLRAKDCAQSIIELISSYKVSRNIQSNTEFIGRLVVKYSDEMVPAYLAHWKRQFLKHRLSVTLKKIPLIDSVVRAVRSKLA